MTGKTNHITQHEASAPIVLVDEAEDDRIEERAWVEATDDVPNPAAALAIVETAYSQEDLAEGESYYADGKQQWLVRLPMNEGDEYQRWNFCDADDEGATLFWAVEVTTP